MSKVKSYSVNTRFKAASSQAMRTTLPADLLYTFGAALYERSNKARRRAENEFWRKTVDRVLKTVKSLRDLEEQYYGS
jgi:predicted DNA-binding protein (UPF0278 family)